MKGKSVKFLVVRTDNIGDLVCTTPVFRVLRKHYPEAYIAAFVNSYNAPVLENNPDINAVYAYTKGKHSTNALLSHWRRLRLIVKLRRQHFDYAILAGAGLREKGVKFARLIGAKHIIGYTDLDKPLSQFVDMPIAYVQNQAGHEVENTFRLLSALGIHEQPPALRLVPNPALVETINTQMAQQFPAYTNVAPIGVHISARKPSNRWPEAYFIELIQALWSKYQLPIMLFWSPGAESNVMHPGDDEKAARILAAVTGIPIFACVTKALPELIAGLALPRAVICSDGGAMHVAAGLGKPIVCFFGNSVVKSWHPWGVKHVVLQPASLDAADVSVGEALSAYESLMASA